MTDEPVGMHRLFGRHLPLDGKAAAEGLKKDEPAPPTKRPFVSFENIKNSPAVVVGVKGEF